MKASTQVDVCVRVKALVIGWVERDGDLSVQRLQAPEPPALMWLKRVNSCEQLSTACWPTSDMCGVSRVGLRSGVHQTADVVAHGVDV